MIQPTVGRNVLFFVRESKNELGFNFYKGKPHVALVTDVHGDRLINVVAFDSYGKSTGFASVKLLQDDDKPDGYAFWCEWMPYQKDQAAKTESLEKK